MAAGHTAVIPERNDNVMVEIQGTQEADKPCQCCCVMVQLPGYTMACQIYNQQDGAGRNTSLSQQTQAAPEGVACPYSS